MTAIVQMTSAMTFLVVVIVIGVVAAAYGVTVSLLDRRRSRQIQADLTEQLHHDEEGKRREP